VIKPSLFIAALLALALQLAPAEAQTLSRTYVSAALGSDANNCDRTTPCRTFQHAHDNTLAAGEITVLDPGGYGAVTIAKAISIINDGVGEAGVLVSGGGTAITVMANAGDAVSLRGLTIKGIGFGGGNGIVFNTGKSLVVEYCAIRNLDTAGYGAVFFYPSTTSSLAISNTVISDNADGISFSPQLSASASAALDHVAMHNNAGIGLFVAGGSTTGTSKVVVTDSIADNNVQGFAVSNKSMLTVLRSVAANNQVGLSAGFAGGQMAVAQSMVTGNVNGWQAVAGGVIVSYGDNMVDANGGSQGAMPVIGKK